MEKQKKWPFFLIIAVVALTIYNILPTIFYYSKPLKSPIDDKRSSVVAQEIIQRVNGLEQDSLAWAHSFCKLLRVKPLSIEMKDPQFLTLNFKNVQDANVFRTHLPRAGALISFVPAQLSLKEVGDFDSKSVTIQRQIPIHINPSEASQYFQFSAKFDSQGLPTPLYRDIILNRALTLGLSLGGPTENALILKSLLHAKEDSESRDLLLNLAQKIVSFTNVYGETSPIASRFFASFSQIEGVDHHALIEHFKTSLDHLLSRDQKEKDSLTTIASKARSEGSFLSPADGQKLDELSSEIKMLEHALGTVKKHFSQFTSGMKPWSPATLEKLFEQAGTGKVQVISLEGRNSFIDALVIDWPKETIVLTPYQDLHLAKQEFAKNSHATYLTDLSDQLLYNEIANASRLSGETILPFQDAFSVELAHLTGSKGFLAMRLSQIAEAEVFKLKNKLENSWHPKHPDLSAENLPIYDYETFVKLPKEQQRFCLVLYAPALQKGLPLQGMRMHSVYVIARGLDPIINRLQSEIASPQTQQFIEDFSKLRALLEGNQFFGYSGAAFSLDPLFKNDFIFEKEDYYQMVLKATREDFTVQGTKKIAVLEFSDVEQRILTENKIDNHIHEDLLKWRDDYLAANLGVKGLNPLDVPKPVKNVYWNNFKLSTIKYFRGDDRKILHWGLDLSGGKTVQIELKDSNHRPVTSEAAIKQGINELYNRVNKMGVSEVSIRREGNYVTLDFPGSQGLSATDLVKASSMYFHVINEKFSPANTTLAQAVNQFLQDVWNEAVVTNRKNSDDVQKIAWRHLHGDSLDPEHLQPRSEAARILYANGLRFSPPDETSIDATLSDLYSSIALWKGDDARSWQGQTHPLLIVFRNFALEGSNLDQVQASYDPSKGNFLSFSVKGSSTRDGVKISPRDDLYAWTSQYAKEKIAGTPLEKISGGRGWRMAVILNGWVISAPTLDSPLKDSAMISGSFTQREINNLEADLKAGSLSFTPSILSEKNVSPELGSQERFHGILATIFSLLLVIGILVGYYRFAGVVASVTVLFTLFLLWATLQNLQATMTLAGIAGIILTLGMAVDANVLVFERIREEFAQTGRIATAVHAGYRKAFSAILDSNVTTLIAALILLQFDSGPIKGFAVTLIIGIIGSFFASLFTAKFFFAHWVRNPAHQSLKMMHLFPAKNFNFLKFTKVTVALSAVIIVIGSFVLIQERKTLFGMDFTGGYALSCEIEPTQDMNYREHVEHALIKAGASGRDIQVRQLNPSNNVRIFLSRSLQEAGHPFYGMPLENQTLGIGFPYEMNPKIVWVVSALKAEGLILSPHTLQNLDKSWTEVSGQMSDTMRNSALIGLTVALLCILLYITIRFEFKYAISATICLAHDLFFTVGVMALLHACKVPIQLDLNTITALMTMIGYSLNDTIIVFDRIREDTKLMRKSKFADVINHALNVTLSRTLLTSGTTLLILTPLLLLGGSTLFGFSLVMAIGVVFGTLSSLFIAAPLMKYFHDKEQRKADSKILMSE